MYHTMHKICPAKNTKKRVFCFSPQAYDSVDRKILYHKLQQLGYRGRVLSLIRSVYQVNIVIGCITFIYLRYNSPE